MTNTLNTIQKLLIFFFLSLFTYIWLQTAWLSDDAYISFRTVNNFVHGLGLTWNPIERVQVFTHPFWVFLISLIYLIIPNIYYAALALSFTLSLTSVLIGLSILKQHSTAAKFVFIFSLLSSRAFIDYTSSGLENPLTFTLVAIFLLVFLKYENISIKKKALLLMFISSLLFFNRMDSILMVLPPLLYSISKFLMDKQYGRKTFKNLLFLLIASTPAWLWLVFSFFYYGFPFPNTAYAKLFIATSLLSKFKQGFYYFAVSAKFDSITLIIIFLAVITGFFLIKRDLKFFLISMGICLYCLYIGYIGGDFMSGRFLGAPFFIGSLILSLSLKKFQWPPIYFFILPLLLIAYNYEISHSPIKNNYLYSEQWDQALYKGIADERGFYYPNTSLVQQFKNNIFEPSTFWSDRGIYITEQIGSIIVFPYIGFFGYDKKEEVYIIDPYALSNAFLARLPAETGRIGHNARKLPIGYLESLSLEKNLISEPHSAKLFDKINLITKGPLFSRKRFKAILDLNF